jgi:hypothetical protein
MFIILDTQPIYKELFPELFKLIVTAMSTLAVSYFLFYKKNTKSDKEKAYDPVISNLFKPFHSSLERNLFHKPTTSTEIASLNKSLNRLKNNRNQENSSWPSSLKLNRDISKLKNSLDRSVDIKKLYKSLKKFDKSIKHLQLEFYLNDFFIYYLDRMLTVLSDLNTENPSSEDLEHLHYYFKQFSSQYLQELQNARKAVGLKKRTLGYRQNFGLYANKPLFYIKIYGLPVASVILIWLIDFISWSTN